MRLLVLLEVVDPLINDLVTYSCDVKLKPIASKAAMRSLVSCFTLSLSGFNTRVPRFGAKLGEGFVLANRKVGMVMRLLVPLQVLHSIVKCLVLASRLWCLLLLLLLSLSRFLLSLLLSLQSLMSCLLLLLLLSLPRFLLSLPNLFLSLPRFLLLPVLLHLLSLPRFLLLPVLLLISLPRFLLLLSSASFRFLRSSPFSNSSLVISNSNFV